MPAANIFFFCFIMIPFARAFEIFVTRAGLIVQITTPVPHPRHFAPLAIANSGGENTSDRTVGP
jgi:hypothetical protein